MSIASEVEAPGEATAGQVAELVRSVAQGDSRAWRKLVEQYEPLVRKITGRYRLNRDDANDVAQVVWLRLFQHISRIREPLALPGWIMTVTRNEALRVLMATAKSAPVDPTSYLWSEKKDDSAGPEDILLRSERYRAARAGLDALAPHQRELLQLLHADLPYAEIGRRMRIPVGSIGPTRARCLEKLRQTSAIRSIS